MSTADRVTYPLWDTEPTVMSPRTAFYHLEPIGLGTPFVESLASYVARLAQAHQVSSVTLTHHAIGRLAVNQFGATLTRSISASGTYKLNGLGCWPKMAVPALQGLTGYNNLRPLTMLSWQQVISQNKLLRPTRAWCPACYEQARQTGQVIYDQLLWSLTPVTHCPRHQQPLQHRCPQLKCQQTLPCISPQHYQGYCSYCCSWLGQAAVADHQPHLDETPWSTWATQSLIELVVLAPDLTKLPAPQRFAELFTFLAAQLTAGNLSALTRRFGLTSLYRFLHKPYAPRLDHLLDLSYHLGLPLPQLLTQPLTQIDVSQLRPPAVRQLRPYRWANSRKSAHLRSVQQALEQIIAAEEEPPLSKSMVARHLGFTASYLSRNFPSLWYQITERYQTYYAVKKQKFRQALEDALTSSEEPPPSGNRVAKRLGTHRSYLIQHFPQLYAQVNQRYHDYIDAHKVTSRKPTGVMDKQTA